MKQYLISIDNLILMYNNGRIQEFIGSIRHKPIEHRKITLSDVVLDVDEKSLETKVIKNRFGLLGDVIPVKPDEEKE